ncbi:MAG: hypothetical protein ACREQY_13130, partial [Candidatus Binatia bacterium]
VNLHPWADEGIEANAARDVRIENNTILKAGLPWSISLRFRESRGFVNGNLSNSPLTLRDGAMATEEGNVWKARREWFVDPAAGDARLVAEMRGKVRAGVKDPSARFGTTW